MNRRTAMGPFVACLAVFGAVAFTQPAAAAPPAAVSYIVVLHDGVAHPGAVADEHARRHGAQVGFVYSSALKGYSAVIPNDRVTAIRNDGRVKYIEADQTAVAYAQTIPWGIAKVGADGSSTLAGNGWGDVASVHAYVIDTGVDAAHQDLTVSNHVNFAGGPNKDCNGHGTHVAGTVGAKDNTADAVGVSPGVSVTGVKVLGCSGSGSYSAIIKGVDWVTANAKKPAVANMSLGGGVSLALDDAVRRSAASGVLYALAAGNDAKDACTTSPARAGAGTSNGIVTVAATDSADKEASFSNVGTCVDIWAPGVSVVSTKNGGGTTTMSGTSMAAPHVAGGGALYLSKNSTTPTSVEEALKQAAQMTNTSSKDGRAIARESVAGF